VLEHGQQIVGVLLEALDVARAPAAATLAAVIGPEHDRAHAVELARESIVARHVLGSAVDERDDHAHGPLGPPQLGMKVDAVAGAHRVGLGLAHARSICPAADLSHHPRVSAHPISKRIPNFSISSMLFALLVPLGACKGESETKTEKPAKPDLAPEATAATGEVPAELKDKLAFEPKELDEGKLIAVVPEGWAESEFLPGKFSPPGSEIGDGVSFSVGTNCDGACSAKDWKAVTDKVEFTGFEPPMFTVETDEKLGETGRLVVYSGGPEVHIRAAWWKADGNRYASCRADLTSSWSMAKAAFIRACKATAVVDWD
jgi:hypothetical protein